MAVRGAAEYRPTLSPLLPLHTGKKAAISRTSWGSLPDGLRSSLKAFGFVLLFLTLTLLSKLIKGSLLIADQLAVRFKLLKQQTRKVIIFFHLLE